MYSVGNFFSTVSKFYNEINPATLSGAIDIIVVQQADGELACSPFHVRFGKLSILRPQDKVVEVRVNGEVVPFSMKVGDAGEAFFVLETSDYVPDEFATSPIAGPTDEADLAPVDYFDLNGQHQQGQQLHLEQQREQRKMLEGMGGQYPQGDEEALLDNGYVSAASGHGSAFEESLKDDSDRESVSSLSSPLAAGRIKEGAASDPLRNMPGSFGLSHGSLQEPESPLPSAPSSSSQPQSNQDQIPHTTESKDNIGFPVDAIFPSVVREELPDGGQGDTLEVDAPQGPQSGRRKSEVLFDMTGYKTDSCSESSDDEDDLPRGILSDSERHHRGLRRKFGKNKSHLSKEQRQLLLEDIKQGAFMKPDESLGSTQMERQASRSHRRKKRAGIPTAWQGKKGRKRANSMPSLGEPNELFSTLARNAERLRDPQPKKMTATTETLPKREPRPSVMSDTEMEYETRPAPASTQSKEWSWGWGGLPVKQSNPDEEDEVQEDTKPLEVPVKIETKEFQMGSATCRVAISLCGEEELGKDLATSHKAFAEAQLTFDAFAKDPAAILADKNLVCYLDGRFYSWTNAVPQLASLLFFHQPLADPAGHDLKDKALAEQDRPSSTRFGTISRWFRKTPAGINSSPSTPDVTNEALSNELVGAVAIGSDDDELRPINKALRSKSLPPLDTSLGDDHTHTHNHLAVPALSEKQADGSADEKRYAKTLRLTSEQLRLLKLNKGANTVSFSVSSAYQGTATCVAKIFLWDHDARVVISDIDGTITKSDALGHIFAMAGRDWTHLGVAKLFTDIRSNGYHILYLTSRAIGQADYTRKYLQKVEQNSYQLPDGPVIMSPDRLFSAFHREVIIRKPEVFKMACLRDIKKLFGDRDPFYAGFGNRITDALSYRAVNVSSSRIFTIDSYGEVKLELLSAFKSSYLALNDLVNEIFPGQRVAPEFNDWNYWKTDLPKIDLPDLPLAADNYSSMGSSNSIVKRVTSLTHSSSSNSVFQPTSPTSPAADTKSKRMSYERSSYATALLGRHETWTSDDDSHEQRQQQNQYDAVRSKSGADQLKDESRKSRAGSPSMLSAFVPTRLIRAVRSGSTSNPPAPRSTSPTPAPQTPEMKAVVNSLPVSPSPTPVSGDEIVRPVSIPSPPPVEGLMQTDEEVAEASRKSLGLHLAKDAAVTGQGKGHLEDLVAVKEEEDDELAAGKLLRRPSADGEGLDEEEGYGGEEEYQGDYEDADDGEEYGNEEEDDDEYLDQMEEDLEEPFL